LKILYESIFREYNGSSSFKYKIVGSLLFALLLKVKDLLKKYQHKICLENRSGEIVRLFKQSLDKHFRNITSGEAEKKYDIKDYAKVITSRRIIFPKL